MNPHWRNLPLASSPKPVNAKTCLTFVSGPKVCGHQIERSDVHRAIRIDGQQVIFFSEIEYQLLFLLIESYVKHEREVSYAEIASKVFGYHIDEDLLMQLRRRISAIRKKISIFNMDIISIPHRGYELRSLYGLALPYKRGHRARLLIPPAVRQDDDLDQ